MAANTQSGSGIKTRWFQIGRKDFQDAGDAVFREFLKEGPPPAESRGLRQFVQHPKSRAWYEQFESIDGIITGITWEKREISGQQQTMMIVTVEDAAERFKIEIGNWDGKFSKNLMQRLCQPIFNPLIQTTLKPYALTATSGEHAGKTFLGITVYNGILPDGKARKIDARYAGDGFPLPQPEIKTETVITGPDTSETKEKRDYRKQAIFLVNWVKDKVIPNLPKDVFVSTNVVEPGAGEFSDDETAGDTFPDDPSFPTTPPPATSVGTNTNVRANHRAEPPDDLPF